MYDKNVEQKLAADIYNHGMAGTCTPMREITQLERLEAKRDQLIKDLATAEYLIRFIKDHHFPDDVIKELIRLG